MVLRVFRRNPLLRSLHQIVQYHLPFPHLIQISNVAAVNPQNDWSLFTVSFSSATSNFQQDSPKVEDPIFAFFHSYGFTDTQIKRFIVKSWSVRSTEIMKPKLEHLLAFGLSPSELVKAICSEPIILTASLKERIEPNLKLLHAALGSKSHTIKAINHGPWFLRKNLEKLVIPNVEILGENSIPMDNIIRMFTRFPRVLVKDPNVIIESINKLKGLGMSLSTIAFVHGMSVMATYKKETWERKAELYRSFGWSEKDTLSVFSRQPNVLGLSDDKFEKKMKFFKEKLWWDSALVAKRPAVLMLSLEGRIIPRCAVLNVLAKKKLWEGKPNLYGLFIMSERNFEKRFVNKYEKEVPQVVDAYEGKVEFTGFDPSIVPNQSQTGVGV